MTLRKFLAAALLALTTNATGLAQTTRPRPAAAAVPSGVQLTAEDMTLVVAGLELPPEVLARLEKDAGERKKFALDIRQMIAAAEEAKSLGYTARPELKLQMELARSFVIAQAYFKQRRKEGAATPDQVVSQAEIDALLAEPAQQQQFAAFVEDYRKNGPGRGAPVSDQQRKELSQHYGRVMVAMRKGTAAGLAADRKTQLAVMLQHSRMLAGEYMKETRSKFNVTEAELDTYVAAHPEYDTKASRAKVEGLLKRARAGEDFEKLAREFSDDPGSRAQGGDLGWFGRGMMVKPFEEAAFALRDGEMSGIVESQFGYHIIKTESRRTQAGGEEVRARHILVRYTNAPSAPGMPPQAPREQARAAAESEKRDRHFDEIAARRNVRVAEDYGVGPAAEAAVAAKSAAPPSAAPAKPSAQPRAKSPAPARRARPGRRN